jgi:hypothetical protein
MDWWATVTADRAITGIEDPMVDLHLPLLTHLSGKAGGGKLAASFFVCYSDTTFRLR